LQQNYIPALWLSGRLFIELGNYERAEQALKRALEIDECHPDANFQFSFVEQHKGNVTGALQALDKALSHSSNPGFKLTIENRIAELKAAPISRFQADDERNLWSIAQRLCGDRSFATELHKSNRDKFVWISQDGSVGYYGLKDCFEESDLQLPEKSLAATVKATCGRFHQNSTITPEEVANN
jgi:tetratricopeptide (TPR) repeat protein